MYYITNAWYPFYSYSDPLQAFNQDNSSIEFTYYDFNDFV